MPKYRLLTDEELSHLEKEFIEYLVINGITAGDWVKMKAEENEKALKIVNLFSDVVLEGAMRKIHYVEFREPNSLSCFHFQEHKAILARLVVMDSGIDLTQQIDEKLVLNSAHIQPELTVTEKEYSETRELELFQWINRGAEVSDGNLFKTLCMVWAEQKAKKSS